MNKKLLSCLTFCVFIFSSHICVEAAAYRLGIGDVISIDVRNLGQSEYLLDALRISDTGTVSLPLIGAIKVKDLSARELESQIKLKLLEGYLNKPEVSVNVVEYRPFFVHGAVQSPGAFPFQVGLTVDKAIALAGGLEDTADEETFVVVREGSGTDTPQKVTSRSNLRPGDILSISSRVKLKVVEEKDEYFYLYGEVRNPGSYVFRDGLTVEKAIILGGGFGPRASKKKVSIRREDPEQEVLVIVDHAELDAGVMPGDVITIGQSFF